jgi:aryl-alcohol dehydrogenase-like predicted oxidoreductase
MAQLFSLRAGDHVNAARPVAAAAVEDAFPAAVEEGTAEPVASAPRIDPLLTGPLSIVARRRLGVSDLAVFPLALGGSVFGWTADGETSVEVLDRYSDLGGNFVDTADSYAGGRSELIIGRWMRERRNRDQVVVATKIGRHADNPGLGSVSIVRAVEASLERLGTDHIDVLTFHDDDQSVPLEDSLATVDWLIESGKVRYLAASNFSAERLIEARILSSTGLPQFIAVHVQHSLMHRADFDGDLRIVTSAQSLAVLPYTALAGGFLTGKYRSKDDVASRTARASRADAYLGRHGHRVLSVLDRIAAEQNVALASVALAWLLAKRNVVAPVASATTPDQVDALMAAAGIRLTRANMLDLDRVSE